MEKTIEERAQAYFQRRYDGGDFWLDVAECLLAEYLVDGYEQGAKEEHERLTRWRDPKEELPEEGVDVLVKCVSGSCVVDFYAAELGCFFGEHATYMQVVGWRPIED